MGPESVRFLTPAVLPLSSGSVMPTALGAAPGTAFSTPMASLFVRGLLFDGLVQLGQIYTGHDFTTAAINTWRAVPLAGNDFLFIDNQMFAQGAVQVELLLMNSWGVANDGATTCLASDYAAPQIAVAGEYSCDYQAGSFVSGQAGYFGHANYYAQSYFTALGNGATHGKFTNGYLAGVAAYSVYDGNVGLFTIGWWLGFFSGPNNQRGTIQNAVSFYAGELNTTNSTTSLGTTNNHYQFYGDALAKATANWGLYILGNQNSYLQGALGIGQAPGTAANAVSLLDIVSTTKGVVFPRMTTTQKNAIAAIEGLIVYDLTLHNYYFWNGSAWTAF